MNHIFSQHTKWINIAKTFGADDLAEDFVQDSYIKILDKEKVNESLFYFVLRNTIADHFRKEKRECYYIEPTQFITEEIYQHIDTWHPYDRKLYLLYINNGMSMRDISKEVNISLTSIYNTIKNCNKKILIFINENHEIEL